MSVGIVGVLSSSVQLQSIDLLLLSFVLLFLFLSHRSVWNLKSVPRPVTFWAKFLNYTIALTSHLQTTKQQLILSLFTFCKPSLENNQQRIVRLDLKNCGGDLWIKTVLIFQIEINCKPKEFLAENSLNSSTARAGERILWYG